MSDWTEDRIKRLKELQAEGLSAAQIANALGGCTRNAVCGKLMHMGLTTLPKGKSMGRVRSAVRRAPPRIVQPRAPKPDALPAPDPIGAIHELLAAGSCKFIHGEIGTDWRMCGHPTPGYLSPWCAFHKAKVIAA